jgi:hypothetical protein
MLGADATLFAIATNLVSSAIWDLATDPAYADDYDFGEPDSQQFAEAVAVAAARVAPSLQLPDAEAIHSTEEFLASDEVRQLVMQLYRTRATEQPAGLSTIRHGMQAVWSNRFRDRPPVLDLDQLLDALVYGCDQILERAIREGSLAAHEAKSAARHALLNERLNGIERQIALLAQQPEIGHARVRSFEREMRTAIAMSYESLDFAHPPGFLRAPLDDIYVTPQFLLEPGARVTPYEELAGQAFRMVVLGGPGSGKTAFARKLCRDLASERIELSGGLNSSGLLLELRDLAPYKPNQASGHGQLRDELSRLAFGALHLRQNQNALEYLLAAGRIAVVFDGLDELPLADERLRVREDLESFAEAYPLAPIMVTSRIVGYDLTPLDRYQYRHAYLAPYGDSEIAEFAYRRFSVVGGGVQQAREISERFVADSEFLNDLRRNPLMLSLLCGLYLRTGYLTRNRIDLYDMCATMFFKQWDAQRGRREHAPILRPAVSRMAWSVLTAHPHGGGLTEDALVPPLVEFLETHASLAPEDTQAAAEEIFDYCHGSSWVMAKIGVNEKGESVFDFTLRALLEFFAAEYAARYASADLVSTVRALVAADQWDTALLAIGIVNRSSVDEGNALADELVARCQDSAERRTMERLVRASLRDVEIDR